MTDHAVDLGVDQLLRGGGALLGIGGIVLGQQLELGALVADLDAGCVELLDRQAGAVSVSWPKWATGPLVGPTLPIFTTSCSAAGAAAPGAWASSFLPQAARATLAARAMSLISVRMMMIFFSGS